ncbi:MAG: arsenate reductase/protein-tyrosine-phosphatase family protein [Acidimicrobiia bacterium]
MVDVQASSTMPVFVELAGHPVRWRILAELSVSDRRVRELTAAMGEPQSLVSYHLGRLRTGGLVDVRRSSADGRDSYYSVDLAHCADLLAAVGVALHPGLRLGRLEGERVRPSGSARRVPRVLFLCTGNSARSQMAEAFMAHGSRFPIQAFSAGSRPKPLHPNAVRVMRKRGVDISGCRAKSVDEFAKRRFDHVVTLCDRVREVCPEFPGSPRLTHWSMPDPSATGTTDRQTYPAFEVAADEIERRVRFLQELIDESRSRR